VLRNAGSAGRIDEERLHADSFCPEIVRAVGVPDEEGDARGAIEMVER
jgi:hypothetical protein